MKPTITGPARVRPATPDDLSRVAEIWVRSWQDAYAGIIPAAYLAELDPQVRLQTLRERFETDPQYETLVAETDRGLVGFAVGGPWRGPDRGPWGRPEAGSEPAGARGELAAIYLDPAHRGRGIGRLLLAAAEQRLAERGFTHAGLWVLSANTPAQRFYTRAGWVPDGTTQTYEVAGVSLPELRFSVRLAHPAANG